MPKDPAPGAFLMVSADGVPISYDEARDLCLAWDTSPPRRVPRDFGHGDSRFAVDRAGFDKLRASSSARALARAARSPTELAEALDKLRARAA